MPCHRLLVLSLSPALPSRSPPPPLVLHPRYYMIDLFHFAFKTPFSSHLTTRRMTRTRKNAIPRSTRRSPPLCLDLARVGRIHSVNGKFKVTSRTFSYLSFFFWTIGSPFYTFYSRLRSLPANLAVFLPPPRSPSSTLRRFCKYFHIFDTTVYCYVAALFVASTTDLPFSISLSPLYSPRT
jgi:hypothetical protein